MSQTKAMWSVFDLNARSIDPATRAVRQRVHEVRPGITYGLTYNQPCPMPEADARVFLKDPAFRVLNAAGEEVSPLDKQALQRTVPQELPPDQVIASLHELTLDALVTRAAQRAGGSIYDMQSDRAEIIDFLVYGPTPDNGQPASAATTQPRPEAADAGEVGEEIEPDDAAALLALGGA